MYKDPCTIALEVNNNMHTGFTLNRVSFTQDEETCILKFLNNARECGHPSANEQWYPVIDSILQKYFDSDVKEAQAWQTV
jgi:hypothetical protein